MKTKIIEVESGDAMDIYADRVMRFEVPSKYSDLAAYIIEQAMQELHADEKQLEFALRNIKYLYSIHDVLNVGGEDYNKVLSVMRSDNRQFTYYLNVESMYENGLKMVCQLNGTLLYGDNLSQLEKDLADIQNGMIKKKDYGFYCDSKKELYQYIGIRKGREKQAMVLSAFFPGQIFEDCDGIEYIVCEHFSNDTVGVITKETIDVMIFGKNNNWNDSVHRNYLNGEFLEELNRKFGEDNIVAHVVDLLSLDGSDDYGYSYDKVSNMTLDRFRKYRKYVGGCHKSYSLSTPNTMTSNSNNLLIEYIDDNDTVGSINCCEEIGIRPFFVIRSNSTGVIGAVNINDENS